MTAYSVLMTIVPHVNFKILATGCSELELLVKQSLLSKRRRSALNGNSDALELLVK